MGVVRFFLAIVLFLLAETVASASAPRGPGIADLYQVSRRLSEGASLKPRNRAGLLAPSAPSSLPSSPPTEQRERKPGLRRAVSAVEGLDRMFEDNGVGDNSHATRIMSKNKLVVGIESKGSRKPDYYYRAYESTETVRLKTRLYPDMQF